jgi:hypothetical protein
MEEEQEGLHRGTESSKGWLKLICLASASTMYLPAWL